LFSEILFIATSAIFLISPIPETSAIFLISPIPETAAEKFTNSAEVFKAIT